MSKGCCDFSCTDFDLTNHNLFQYWIWVILNFIDLWLVTISCQSFEKIFSFVLSREKKRRAVLVFDVMYLLMILKVLPPFSFCFFVLQDGLKDHFFFRFYGIIESGGIKAEEFSHISEGHIHTHMRTYTHTLVRHTQIHTCTCTHIRIHTWYVIPTHSHTQIHTSCSLSV